MEQIKIIVKGNKACLYGSVQLIAGTVGQTCRFYFDDSWKNLNKQVNYKIGQTIVATEDIVEDQAPVPPKALLAAGLPFEIGITGYALDNSTIIPTSWCYIGEIQNGSSVPNVHVEEDIRHVYYDGGVITAGEEVTSIIYDGGVIS